MRKAAMVLGIIGGLLIATVGVWFAIEAVEEVARVWARPLAWGILLPTAIAAGALALTKPKLAGILMVASVISGGHALGFIGFSLAYVIVIFSFIPGCARALALASREEQPAAAIAAVVRKVARFFGFAGGSAGILGLMFIVWEVPQAEAMIAAWPTLFSLVMAIGGGALAPTKPKLAGILMLASAISGWSAFFSMLGVGVFLCGWSILVFGIMQYLASWFLLPGTTLALTSNKKWRATTYVIMTLGIMGAMIFVPIVLR